MKTLTDFPDYVAASDKLNAVQARHAAAVAERDARLTELNNASARPASMADAAQRLLDGGVDLPAPGSLREQYGSAQRQVSLLAEVCRLAKQRLEDARAITSQTICAEARPEFSRLVQAELQAAHTLLSAQAARRAFWQDLNDGGVSMSAMPQTAPLIHGDLHDQSAVFWLRVADAVELGYIEPDTFAPPAPKPERMGAGQHIAAGPGGVREVIVDAAGTVAPGKWLSKPATKAAPAWNDAA